MAAAQSIHQEGIEDYRQGVYENQENPQFVPKPESDQSKEKNGPAEHFREKESELGNPPQHRRTPAHCPDHSGSSATTMVRGLCRKKTGRQTLSTRIWNFILSFFAQKIAARYV